MKLSEFAIRKAKPKPKAYRLSDGGGLFLLVQPNGSKLWQLRYRWLKKENILSFGSYPMVTLAEARTKRGAAKKQLNEGVNPSAQRRLDQIAAETAARSTFGLVADEYIERLIERGAAEATVTKTTWLLKDLAKPLSNRPIKDSHPAEILADARRHAGAVDSSHRQRASNASIRPLVDP